MVSRERAPTRRAVTRADVARYAGVSTAVVSYVVNNGPKPVSPQTAARVREAIDLLKYRPNVNAQALRKGTTEMLGLIMGDPANPYYSEFAAAIGTAARRHGHALMMGNSYGDPDTELSLIDDLSRRQVDGILVASIWDRPDLQTQVHARVPILWLDEMVPTPGFPSVGSNGYVGAKAAVEHLLDVHGHTSVGLVIGDTSGGGSADPRERGWLDALREGGRPDGPVVRVDWSREGGHAGGARLLNTATPPTAIFASSDLQAIGLLRAAYERGLRIPEDLAVIAFDGTKESEFCWPPLTVLAQPLQQMADAAVALILDRDRGDEHVPFEPRLIVRRSCGCGTPSGSLSPSSSR